MAQVCTVCAHPKTKQIEHYIVQGKPNTQIGEMYGLDHQSVRYHSIHHLPDKLVKAVQAERADHADNILTGIRNLLTRTKKILDKAEAKGHNRLALEAIKEARSTYELLSKIAVKLAEYRQKDKDTEQVHIRQQIQEGLEVLSTPELKTYIALQSKIYAAQSEHELSDEARVMVESMKRQEWLPDVKLQRTERKASRTTNGTDTDTDPQQAEFDKWWNDPANDPEHYTETDEQNDRFRRGNPSTQDKNSQKHKVSHPDEPEPQFEVLEDLELDNLELDDLELDSSKKIPSEKDDPKWLVQWRLKNQYR